MTTHWVGIGDIKVGRSGEMLAAVLGSCVSILLWHPVRRLAFMNHVLLPGRQAKPDDGQAGRYADESWQVMRRYLAAERVAPQECTCHVLGGGRSLDGRLAGDIGRDNLSRVFDLLFEQGIWIDGMDTGGRHFRVVKFEVERGELIVHRHRTSPAQPLALQGESA